MHIPRLLPPVAVALALVAAPLGAAVGDTSGRSTGTDFTRDVSGTPDLPTSKGKIDGFQFYVPARDAEGDPVSVEYRDARGRLVQNRDEARPLLSVYVDDDPDPANGDDVWAAVSLDDGDTWRRTNLSMAADRSSFTVNEGDAESAELDYPGMVSKPGLTLKGNRVLVSWTSTFCDSGFPAYEGVAEDPHGVAEPQRSVDYADQGYPEVGEVPYKCLWATRGLVDTTSGDITWYQPERLTSGGRYAMQVASNSAPGAGFVIGWAEDPEGVDPGEGRGPGDGWTGASPHPGTDVWYTYLPMTAFNAAATAPVTHPEDPEAITARPQPLQRFTVPSPVSDNALPSTAAATTGVGATRPAVSISPYSVAEGTGTVAGAWVAYGYEETKEGEVEVGDPEAGKQVLHHAFHFDAPDVSAPGDLMSDPWQSARRVRYITQPVRQMGPSRTLGALIYRMGADGHSGSADFLMHRFVVPAADTATDNPFRTENFTEPLNLSATTPTETVPDPTTGVPRVTRWGQTEANLDDSPGESSLESARGHRGMIKGDFLNVGYLWTANWDLYLQGLDIENYYVRRSFDGGATFTSAPAEAPYDGDGVTSCRYFNDPVTGALRNPVCREVGPGEFEPAQNLTRLDGFDETAIEPRLVGMPGSIPVSAGSGTDGVSPYPEDVQDVSTVWQVWGTGSPQDATADGDGDYSTLDADVPVPGEDPGKGPLDVYYTFSQDYGDTFVENATLADGPSAQGEAQVRFSPDGSKLYAAWNDLGGGGGDQHLDVFFRRLTPDAFPNNTIPDRSAPTSKADSRRLVGEKAFQVFYDHDDGDGSGVRRVALFVKAPGATSFSRARVDIGDAIDGRFRFLAGAGDGVYRFHTVAVDEADNREAAPAIADTRTRVDTRAPRIVDARVVPNPFDIGDDRWTRLRVRVDERSQKTFVVKHRRVVVKRIQTRFTPPGVVGRKWYGRSDTGRLVPDGRYVVVMKARDRAGNVARERSAVDVTR